MIFSKGTQKSITQPLSPLSYHRHTNKDFMLICYAKNLNAAPIRIFLKVRLRKYVNLFDKFRIEQTDVKRDKFN